MKFRFTSGLYLTLGILMLFLCSFCRNQKSISEQDIANFPIPIRQVSVWDSVKFIIHIPHDIKIRSYFEFMDSLVEKYDTLLPYSLTEHLLVRANPWIIDSLVATDYYHKKAQGVFIYDQKEQVILQRGDSLFVPKSNWATQILKKQEYTLIDINIPEFTLRIFENGELLFRFPVRVGRPAKRYLATAGREEDLRTRTGLGKIVKIVKDPLYMNPVDGHHYAKTRRDDEKLTLLPQIPFLHPEINGHRWGQLIHPTTNPVTLGKAYSNGCIGTSEGDAWRLYYHAPIGTTIQIRYDLEVLTENGDTLRLDDIYRKLDPI